MFLKNEPELLLLELLHVYVLNWKDEQSPNKMK